VDPVGYNKNEIELSITAKIHKKGGAMKLKELDVVEPTKELPQIPGGTRGTVIFVYPGGDEVEVEFVDQEGNTLGVEKVSVEFLRKTKEKKMKKNSKSFVRAEISELMEHLTQEQQVRIKNTDKVKKYLMEFGGIFDVVQKAVNSAKKHFPEAQLVLDLYEDPEMDNRHLVLYVRLKKYNELVMEKVREAREEYREDLITRINKTGSEFWDDLVDKKGYIFMTTDFQKPEE